MKDWFVERLIFFVILFIGLTPQFAAWLILYGTPITIPQGSGFIEFKDLPLLDILFSLNKGLFLWHPLLLLGVVGLSFLWRKDRILTISLVLIFIFQWILNASVLDWSASWSFGHRRFISLLPVLAIGIALVFQQLEGSKRMMASGIAVVIFLSLWNMAFVYQYKMNMLPHSGKISFKQFVTDKFNLPELTKYQIALSSAIYYAGEENMGASRYFAMQAFELDPTNTDSHAIYGYVCLKINDYKTAEFVFQEWNKIEPKEIIPKWILAEFMIRRGRRDQAMRMLFQSERYQNDFDLYEEIGKEIVVNATSIIDSRFMDRLVLRIKHIKDR